LKTGEISTMCHISESIESLSPSSTSSSFICVKVQKSIQTSRSTKAKYALTDIRIKGYSLIHANL